MKSFYNETYDMKECFLAMYMGNHGSGTFFLEGEDLMENRPACSSCNTQIQEGDEHLFYSTMAKPAGIFMDMDFRGSMWFCQSCAKKICTPKVFAKKLPKRFGYTVSGFDDFREICEQVNKKSIVDICRAHGLTPEQALQKARELGNSSFSDADAIAREAWLDPLGNPKRYIRLGPNTRLDIPSWGPDSTVRACFIATACYASDSHPDVVSLRSFRDRYLTHRPLGRAFVCFYYRISPPLANWIGAHKLVRMVVRMALLRPVVMIIHLIDGNIRKKD